MPKRSRVPRNIQKSVLSNGLPVITERVTHVRSVSTGVWIGTGSRDESPEENGISHFVEHMVFKGTKSLSAEDIAFEIDSIGGQVDAFTTKENVAFTAKVVDEHLPRALDVLANLAVHPAFRPEDIGREKKVVLEERKMDEDNPEYLIEEIFSRSFWKGHSLCLPIIGDQKNIRAFDRPQISKFFRRTYRPWNMMITAAGNLRHDDFVKQIEARYGHLPKGTRRKKTPSPEAKSAVSKRRKPTLEQVQLCLGVPACAITDERRHTAYVMNTILGAGASSRLFLKVREQAGLVYSIFSDLSMYRDAGALAVMAGTGPTTADQVIAMIVEEFRELKEKDVPEAELRRAKDHLKGSILLGLESTGARMHSLARQEGYFGRVIPVEEINDSLERVTASDIRSLANELLRPERVNFAALGKLDGLGVGRKQLVF